MRSCTVTGNACLFPSLYRASVSAVVCVLAGDETIVAKPYPHHNSIQLHDKPGGAAWPTAIIFCLLSVQTLRVPLCVWARERKKETRPESVCHSPRQPCVLCVMLNCTGGPVGAGQTMRLGMWRFSPLQMTSLGETWCRASGFLAFRAYFSLCLL